MAKDLLKQQYDRLMLDEHQVCTQVKTVKHILVWCEHQDIEPGKWIKKDKLFRFTRQGIDKIRDAYQAIMSEDIFADFTDDTHQSASRKSDDEKQGKVKPTQYLILTALTKNITFDGFQREYYPCPQVNLEMHIRALDYSNYDSLVMIENRDSFNDWHLFQPYLSGELGKTLAIYRGDSHYSSAAMHLLQQWRSHCPHRPVVYFGDFDLMGLRIALSADCTHLLLPRFDWLIQQLVGQHYPAKQETFLHGLEEECPSGWLSLLGTMSKRRAGLRQQKMYDVPLILYPKNTK